MVALSFFCQNTCDIVEYRLVLQRLLLSHWCQVVEMQVQVFQCLPKTFCGDRRFSQRQRQEMIWFSMRFSEVEFQNGLCWFMTATCDAKDVNWCTSKKPVRTYQGPQLTCHVATPRLPEQFQRPGIA